MEDAEFSFEQCLFLLKLNILQFFSFLNIILFSDQVFYKKFLDLHAF